jgi:NADH:ubiquinone oxidoreductase subunit 4 (subunit M)
MANGFVRQREVMEDSGLGLLPGLALAFVAALLIIAGILLNTWWATALAVAGVFATAAAVIYVVWQLVLSGPDDQ